MQKMAAKRYLSNRQVWPGLQNEAVTIVVQLLSHVRLCDPMSFSMPGFPVLHHLPEFAQTHVP